MTATSASALTFCREDFDELKAAGYKISLGISPDEQPRWG